MNMAVSGTNKVNALQINKYTENNMGNKEANTPSEPQETKVTNEMNPASKPDLGQEDLVKAITRAFQAIQGPPATLELSFHDKTHELMIKVLNKDTGELIREIPSEKWLDVVAKMREIAGILIDERV